MVAAKLHVGERYDKLVVEARAGTRHGRALWRFRCDCGNAVERISDFLARHNRHSCGCLRSELMRGKSSNRRSHGMTETRLYDIWCSIKQRCYNSKATAFKNYGGRGIVMCDEWREDFAAFASWAEANGRQQGLDIDRRDNDGPYAPENCRFVTRADNQSNTRVAVVYSYWGERLTLSEATRRFRVDKKTIRSRIAHGMTPEQAIEFKGRLPRLV